MEKVELAKEIADVNYESTGQLNEFTERTSWPHEVLCMSLSELRNCLSTLVAMAEDENVPVASVDDESFSAIICTDLVLISESNEGLSQTGTEKSQGSKDNIIRIDKENCRTDEYLTRELKDSEVIHSKKRPFNYNEASQKLQSSELRQRKICVALSQSFSFTPVCKTTTLSVFGSPSLDSLAPSDKDGRTARGEISIILKAPLCVNAWTRLSKLYVMCQEL
ncbi:unnamed protein product [Cylicocyclus nassatus]|uniref:Uncharacterized protein n=1 Tax=Cylicocyclus nassatus TaxID=53992 RepID=A0AA36GJX1_CYLNA|nr:unnamed protein product [Cylicocyclus nassatus]